ncbi:Tas retrotransposon peptidase A16 [Oesophagostomum dentatum]|uniref:Tas retrotransposon peptidase A16 n=1 Tax=Oesophagostomum dentatum TaxID=61180 RepID=A0A0B1TCK4_OESDE|nr:Tas retrotransposon peptidase A16 [Oesophagostomum dentatum]
MEQRLLEDDEQRSATTMSKNKYIEAVLDMQSSITTAIGSVTQKWEDLQTKAREEVDADGNTPLLEEYHLHWQNQKGDETLKEAKTFLNEINSALEKLDHPTNKSTNEPALKTHENLNPQTEHQCSSNATEFMSSLGKLPTSQWRSEGPEGQRVRKFFENGLEAGSIRAFSSARACEKVTVLLDTGSQHSYIREGAGGRLNLVFGEFMPCTVRTFGGNTSVELSAKTKVTLIDTAGKEIVLHLTTRKTITSVCSNSVTCCENLREDKDYIQKDVEIDILIGIDYYWDVVCRTPVTKLQTGLAVLETRFGPILYTNDYDKLVRIVSFVLKFLKRFLYNRLKNDSQNRLHHILNLGNIDENPTLTIEEIELAENLIIHHHYRENDNELKTLLQNKTFKLEQDHNGIYHGVTRMMHAAIPEHSKHPILLLPGHTLTSLIIRKTHFQEESFVNSFLVNERIKWKFITPLSPWQGGFYERLVGSVKNALKKTVLKAVLTRRNLETLILEIEAALNTRPLIPLNNPLDDKEIKILRPIDLLHPWMNIAPFIRSSSTSISYPTADSETKEYIPFGKYGKKTIYKL